MVDAWEFCVLDVRADPFQCRSHAARLLDRDTLVRVAVKDPDWDFRNSLRDGGVRIGGRHDWRIEHATSFAAELADKSADRNESSKALGIMRCEIPASV